MKREARVLGAGPAGLSAAVGLLRRGVRVTVRERRRRWTGRVCGGFLSAEALRHLRWLELEEAARAAGGAPVTAVRVTSAWGHDEILPLPSPGLALPRHALEDILLQDVLKRGGKVEWGELENPAGTAPDVLAAGRFGGGPPPKGGRGWYGWNTVFHGTGSRPGEMSLHFGPGCYVGTLAFTGDDVNVSGLTYKEGALPWEAAFQRMHDALPGLRDVLRDGRRSSEWLGAGPLPFGARRPTEDGALAVGDAAAVGDPFFGEGIGRALAAGPHLFDAWPSPDPAAALRRRQRRDFAGRAKIGSLLRHTLRIPVLASAALSIALFCRLPSRLSHLRG